MGNVTLPHPSISLSLAEEQLRPWFSEQDFDTAAVTML
jgi:hypothetical protein